MRSLKRVPWWVVEPVRWLLIVRVVNQALVWVDDPTLVADTETGPEAWAFAALALVFAVPPIALVARVRDSTEERLAEDSDLRVVRDAATALACGLVALFGLSRFLIRDDELSNDRIERSQLTEGDVYEKFLRVGFETIPPFAPDALGWEDPIRQPSSQLILIVLVLQIYLGIAVVAAIVRLYRVHRRRLDVSSV